jgi:hypothetical protein
MPTFGEKLIALVSLTGVSTAIGFTIKYSMSGGRYAYSPISAVTMTELFKLVASILVIIRLVVAAAADKGTSFEEQARTFVKENYSTTVALHNIGLALAYAIVNLVTYGVFIYAPASTFFLLKAASPVVTALLLAVLVRRPISSPQWVAIVAQCIGLFATQYDPCKSTPAVSTTGYIFVFINIAVSCAAGVWNENIIKTYHVSVNAQNSLMYSAGVIVNLFLFFVMPPEAIGGNGALGFFEGYNWKVIAVIVANGSIGLVITAVYKYADVVVKTFGLAGSTVTLLLLEGLGLLPSNAGFPKTPALIGAGVVFYAAYVYIAPPITEAVAARTPTGEKQPIAAASGEAGVPEPQQQEAPLTRNPRVAFTFIGCVVVFYTLFVARMKCE